MSKRLYFDYNATTPLAPSVRNLLQDLLHAELGNPSSLHFEGREARRRLDEAREKVASLLGCREGDVFFTSGATEANNAVLFGLWKTRLPGRNKIISTAIEHSAILKPLELLKAEGAEVVLLPVNNLGEVDLVAYEKALDDQTHLVSVMMANNETGIRLPLQKMAALAHQHGALFHTDAACGVGKIDFSFQDWGLDALTLSGHKFYAPKGIGAFLLKKEFSFAPLIAGGAHERGKRAGTENFTGILGLAEGLHYALEGLESEEIRLQQLRAHLKEGLRKARPDVVFHEHPVDQLPGTLNISFPGLAAQTLIARLDLEGVAVSGGSACHSGSLDGSHVLLAMGFSEEDVMGSIRLSFGRMTTEEEIDRLGKIFKKILNEIS